MKLSQLAPIALLAPLTAEAGESTIVDLNSPDVRREILNDIRDLGDKRTVDMPYDVMGDSGGALTMWTLDSGSSKKDDEAAKAVVQNTKNELAAMIDGISNSLMGETPRFVEDFNIGISLTTEDGSTYDTFRLDYNQFLTQEDSPFSACTLSRINWPDEIPGRGPSTFIRVMCRERSPLPVDPLTAPLNPRIDPIHWFVFAEFPTVGPGERFLLGAEWVPESTDSYWFTMMGIAKPNWAGNIINELTTTISVALQSGVSESTVLTTVKASASFESEKCVPNQGPGRRMKCPTYSNSMTDNLGLLDTAEHIRLTMQALKPLAPYHATEPGETSTNSVRASGEVSRD